MLSGMPFNLVASLTNGVHQCILGLLSPKAQVSAAVSMFDDIVLSNSLSLYSLSTHQHMVDIRSGL